MPQLRHRCFPRVMALAGLVLLFGTGATTAQPAPRQVVSLNLCADQLLLALADRDQIASLSPLVTDRPISFLANDAVGLPVNAGKGEAIVFGGADLVLAGPYDQQARAALLRRHGVEVLMLDPWHDLQHGREQIRMLARRLGHPERGEALIGRIDAALERARDLVPAKRSILTYGRRGWVQSSDSLIGELLRHLGFVLHQEALNLGQGGIARLESVVADPPDYILTDDDVGQAVDNGSALFVHPALAGAIPQDRRLAIPGRLAICGGPSTPALIDALAEEVRAKVR